jgi:hypothetical protein
MRRVPEAGSRRHLLPGYRPSSATPRVFSGSARSSRQNGSTSPNNSAALRSADNPKEDREDKNNCSKAEYVARERSQVPGDAGAVIPPDYSPPCLDASAAAPAKLTVPTVLLVHHTGKPDKDGNVTQRGTSKREDILNTTILLT